MALRVTGSAIWHTSTKLALRTGPARLFPAFFMANLQCGSIFRTPANRLFQTSPVICEMPLVEYEKVSKASLENLCEYFEELVEDVDDADVNLSDGVLTVKLGKIHGTYVINKQTPNRQIWLSSPISGPKRYDYVNSEWIYKHGGGSLNDLLTQEMREILQNDEIDFSHCV
ncbi:frataxin -like protein [Tropilaelaps mercedesae]|uniref:ferroxidase n=1 Tax=Tropilaelaps mercedesae TaxID=418985 RepID=A0A1V9XZQ7_9ACAR|nr:frataxin -like protein [Tropilaelaps mercedesae]